MRTQWENSRKINGDFPVRYVTNYQRPFHMLVRSSVAGLRRKAAKLRLRPLSDDPAQRKRQLEAWPLGMSLARRDVDFASMGWFKNQENMGV
jgi:hypothetical protein